MKLHHIAAATLLIGTSALAWAPQADPALDATWEPTATAAGDPNLDLAVKPDAAVPEVAVAKVADAEAADPEALDTGTADTSPAGVGGPVETAEAPAVTTAALDPTPHPAAQNYPPCAPGPGDDNCIQLYEPGVRMALASWNQPTGGLIDGQAATETAMGGPYEPVEGGSAEAATNGDGEVDAAMGETDDI